MITGKQKRTKAASFILTFCMLFFFTACKNYYNDTLNWADTIKRGTDIRILKNNQSDYVTIDWNKPDTLENGVAYTITRIKGNKDFLNMAHLLVFSNGQYQGRSSKK